MTLPPCPFCGSPEVRLVRIREPVAVLHDLEVATSSAVVCTSCGVEVRCYTRPVAQAWGSRAQTLQNPLSSEE